VQEGATAAVDSAHSRSGERQQVLLVRGGIVEIVEKQPAPAAPDTENLVSGVKCSIDNRLDRGI
jgi:hypothetical protein